MGCKLGCRPQRREYVEIDFGKMDIDDLSEARAEIRQILREGLDRWEAAGKDTSRYMGGSFTAVVTYDKVPRYVVPQPDQKRWGSP